MKAVDEFRAWFELKRRRMPEPPREDVIERAAALPMADDLRLSLVRLVNREVGSTSAGPE